VVGGVVALVGSLFWLGASRFDVEVVKRVTYLDESVQGLEIGAPVKIRGVTIGSVTDILLAPDRRLVEVHSDLRVESLRRLHLLEKDEEPSQTTEDVPPEIRITVAAQGITGIKFLEADYFPPDSPTIELSFDPPDNYIPSAPSTLKNLEDALRELATDLPPLLREIRALTRTTEEKLAAVDTARLSSSFADLAESLTSAIEGTATTGLGPELIGLARDLRTAASSFDRIVSEAGGEGGWADRGLSSIEGVAAEMRTTVERIDQILVAAEIPATSESIRVAAGSASSLADGFRPVGGEATLALSDMREALRAIQRLAELLERDPGALLRGRAFASKR
ncbi:MAG: MlaD family protein, partial [Planctomycetota bacterium]